MRLIGRLVWIAAVVGSGVLGWWAGRTVLEPPGDPLIGPDPITYSVTEGHVGRTMNVTAVAEWELVPLARAEAVGVVTAVEVDQGSTVDSGDVLFTVGLRPTVVAQGDTPAFREMRIRDEGPDVAQLQTFLADLGLFGGEPDGIFGTGTVDAVRGWQTSLDLPADGVVRLGDVVFVSRLPSRVALGEQIVVGNRLVGGEEAVFHVPDDPRFWIPLAPEQRTLIPLDVAVDISYGRGEWRTVTTEATETVGQQGISELRLELTGRQGGSVCGADCAEWVPLRGRTDFPARVVIVPDTFGPVVPVAAIKTDLNGSTFVTLESGEKREARVLASANGLAVVEGIHEGQIVVMPFDSTNQVPDAGG